VIGDWAVGVQSFVNLCTAAVVQFLHV